MLFLSAMVSSTVMSHHHMNTLRPSECDDSNSLIIIVLPLSQSDMFTRQQIAFNKHRQAKLKTCCSILSCTYRKGTQTSC